MHKSGFGFSLNLNVFQNRVASVTIVAGIHRNTSILIKRNKIDNPDFNALNAKYFIWSYGEGKIVTMPSKRTKICDSDQNRLVSFYLSSVRDKIESNGQTSEILAFIPKTGRLPS